MPQHPSTLSEEHSRMIVQSDDVNRIADALRKISATFAHVTSIAGMWDSTRVMSLGELEPLTELPRTCTAHEMAEELVAKSKGGWEIRSSVIKGFPVAIAQALLPEVVERRS